jgi:hypothetical protein
MLTIAVLLAGLAFLNVSPSGAADDFKPEPGFTLLFNGRNLSGWKVRGGDALEGKTETKNARFKVADDCIVIDAKAKGNMVIDTTREFGKDVHIKFEFLPGAGCNNDLYLRGLKFDLKKPDVKNMKEGMWNEFEIILQGNKAEFKCNGEVQRTATATMPSTVLGVRAEFGPIQIRRIRFKEAP